jgi:hypothetical protein
MMQLWVGPFLAILAAQPPYEQPPAGGPVVVLLDEATEGLFPLLANASGEPGTIAREDRDVFAGLEAVRVTPVQRYMAHLPGWNYTIAESPKADEYRYVRFAWKKRGGTGVMIQLHDANKQGWGMRYHAGQNPAGWGSKMVSSQLPADWAVVTRDLFQDFGASRVTGIAFSPMDGEAALFDLVLLGRSVADLDRATDEALGRVPRPLAGKQRDALWRDLLGADRGRAVTAYRAFLAAAPDQPGYIRDHLPRADEATLARVRELVGDLDDDRFLVREAATRDLIRIGRVASNELRLAAKSDSPETRRRAELVLSHFAAPHAHRVVRVLERAGNADARGVLVRLAAGEYGAEYVDDAKAALAGFRIR